MSAEESLYPKIPEYVPVENVSDKINRNLSDARIKEIQAKRHEMEMSLKHYKKILKRWRKIGKALIISSFVIVGGCTATTIVLGFGAFLPPFVIGIMAAIGWGEGVLSETLVFGVVRKKLSKFKKKIEHIQEYISKSWYLFEKIRGDGIVTLQEVEEFGKLMDQYEKGVSIEESNADDSMDKEYLKLRETLKKQAEKEVRKEVKVDLKNDLKNELKQKYLHK
jgi:hypothetical protein